MRKKKKKKERKRRGKNIRFSFLIFYFLQKTSLFCVLLNLNGSLRIKEKKICLCCLDLRVHVPFFFAFISKQTNDLFF